MLGKATLLRSPIMVATLFSLEVMVELLLQLLLLLALVWRLVVVAMMTPLLTPLLKLLPRHQALPCSVRPPPLPKCGPTWRCCRGSKGAPSSPTWPRPGHARVPAKTDWTPPTNCQPPTDWILPTNYQPPIDWGPPTNYQPPTDWSPPTNCQLPTDWILPTNCQPPTDWILPTNCAPTTDWTLSPPWRPPWSRRLRRGVPEQSVGQLPAGSSRPL